MQQRFAVTHPGVLKWEGQKNKPNGMNWATEKDIRLFALLKLTSKSKAIVDLYTMLEKVICDGKNPKVEVDAHKLAA